MKRTLASGWIIPAWTVFFLSMTAFVEAAQQAVPPSAPIAAEDLVLQEVDGVLAIEAEHFCKQSLTEKRGWYVTSSKSAPDVKPDGDPPHVGGASGGAYIEVLPDTRRGDHNKLIDGENFSNQPGKMAVLHYKVRFTSPGRYYVWVRAYSTTSEDNGLHFGLNGQWPESGQRWQTVAKNGWNWDCKQRTQQVHTGVPMQLWLDVEKAGDHELQVAMREDGIELDKFVLAKSRDFKPEGLGPEVKAAAGKLPEAFPFVEAPAPAPVVQVDANALLMTAASFPLQNSGYYLDRGQWLAINPEKNKEAKTSAKFPFASGLYDVTLHAVGEEDGSSTYQVLIGEAKLGDFKCPVGGAIYEEGPQYNMTWKGIQVKQGDEVTVCSQIGSTDGKEFSRARIAQLAFAPADEPTRAAAKATAKKVAAPAAKKPVVKKPAGPPLVEPRKPDGSGEVAVSGEPKQWHKVTLTLDGPFAHEQDNQPNPFTDYRMTVRFAHESASPSYEVPGYFAADGKAGETSAELGTKWRAHLSPDKPGKWTYAVSFVKGKGVALDAKAAGEKVAGFDGKSGTFEVAKTDKTGRDFRGQGRLQYVGKHHLRFAGSGEYFLKAGPDSPETFLAYADFDGTRSGKKPGTAREGEATSGGLKTWQPHVQDWRAGDPTWKGGKGKGMIGALNYLASKGCNAFSFMPYNAGGDGDNVWPLVDRDDKMHYDCSKLDQWQIVFDHAQSQGLYLHFKLQETEMDDLKGPGAAQSLDGGDLGPERKLYCRELIARFAYELALNWNIGEENTQSPEQQRAMAGYLHEVDPYDHLIVIHTFPGAQDEVYTKLLGDQSLLTGASLQNGWNQAHQRTLKWVVESANAGKPWVVANDEQGPASLGVPADPGYANFDGMAKEGKDAKAKPYNLHDIRKATLWGTLTAGGAGVEYYFGYTIPQNDLVCEDFRSRDKSWDYCRIALEFFRDNKIPYWEMSNADALVDNAKNDNSKYCLAKPGEMYVVYLPSGGTTELDLTKADGSFQVLWFNPRTGGQLQAGSVKQVTGGKKVALGNPPQDPQEDWTILVRK